MQHYQDIGYTFVGRRSSSWGTVENAMYSQLSSALSEEEIADLLSEDGLSRNAVTPVAYRKYRLDAYLGNVLVDRITFVCRF